MTEAIKEKTYEFRSEDGSLTDECVLGATVFRVKRKGIDREAEFLWLIRPLDPITEDSPDTRRVHYPHELSDEIKAEFHKGYQGEPTPELDHLMK